jgi:putative endonuclease
MDRQTLGKLGEDLAVLSLEKNGYQIKERNFRVRAGEVDIVAVDDDVLVFVEVKARSGKGFGTPAEAVSLRKQQQIAKAALFYINKHDLHNVEARFDVVSVLIQKTGTAQIELIKNAFDLSYG